MALHQETSCFLSDLDTSTVLQKLKRVRSPPHLTCSLLLVGFFPEEGVGGKVIVGIQLPEA